MQKNDKQKKWDACREKLAPEAQELEAAYQKYNDQVKYERDHPTKQKLFGIFWPDSRQLGEAAANERLEYDAKMIACQVDANPLRALKKAYTGRD